MVEIPVKAPGGGYVQALVDDRDVPLVSLFRWYLREDGSVTADVMALTKTSACPA